MKLLFLTSYFYPEFVASSYIGDNIREALCDSGCRIELFAPCPSRGVSPEMYNEYRYKTHEFMHEGKLSVHRFFIWKEPHSIFLRAFRFLLMCFYQTCNAVFHEDARQCDAIFVASTPPIQGLIGAFLKKIKHIPFVYNLQDIFPDSLVGTGLAKKDGLLWRVGRVMENFTYRHADKIIVISEDFKRNIMAKGVSEDKIVVVYYWVDQNAVVDVPRQENKLFDRYGLDRSFFYLSYCGNVGLTQNMDMLLEIMEELKSDYPNIHLVIVGEGAYKSNVESAVAERGLDNVHLLPFQPYEDISHVFSLGDVGLVISKPGVGANSVPSKTWSILSASRPVLVNFDENELKKIVSDCRCGIFTKAGDKEAFRSAVIRLYSDASLCKEMGANGREFIMQNLTKEVGTQKYVDVIKGLCPN